ncbi:thioredoxin family protein [Sphingomonas sp.]|jgi:thiol:disulfide interchange protein|uniref:thioredoxin family protein n=1 Tax=Sphingomonas sp. TaxID=28214 RepID=UPI002EDAF353
MMRRFGWLVALAALALPSIAAAQSAAPRLAARTIDRLPKPLPAPYDAAADARADIAAAVKRARASRRPLLIDFGANWCVDCRIFVGVLELPEMRGWVARNFELVQVDVGRFDRNLDIAARYGIKELAAVPAVFVVDAKSGKLLNPREVFALGEAGLMQPQTMADWLARWARPAR